MVGREGPISVRTGQGFLEDQWTITSWQLEKKGRHLYEIVDGRNVIKTQEYQGKYLGYAPQEGYKFLGQGPVLELKGQLNLENFRLFPFVVIPCNCLDTSVKPGTV